LSYNNIHSDNYGDDDTAPFKPGSQQCQVFCSPVEQTLDTTRLPPRHVNLAVGIRFARQRIALDI
jgi:hypothetical protein